MRTDPSTPHWIVELGWVTAAAIAAVATLDFLGRTIDGSKVPSTVPAVVSPAPPDRSGSALDAVLLAPLLGLPLPAEPVARDAPPQREPTPVAGDHTPWLRVREVESTHEVWESPRTSWGTGCCPPDARIVPMFREGRALGFALVQIRPGSLYAKLGLVDGDIVRRINGLEMTSPEHALDAYARLKDTKTIVLDLERGGTAVRKTYIRRSGDPPSPSPPPR